MNALQRLRTALTLNEENAAGQSEAEQLYLQLKKKYKGVKYDKKTDTGSWDSSTLGMLEWTSASNDPDVYIKTKAPLEFKATLETALATLEALQKTIGNAR